MRVNRRDFLKRGAGLVTVGCVLPGVWLRPAMARDARAFAKPNRKLVIIQLEGGNDGLNTVVPYTDANYFAHRPKLGLRDTDLQTPSGVSTILTERFGLHPALAPLKEMYDAGRMAVTPGVGYPNPTLSHFLSMDIWHTADLSGRSGRGWLGRYADVALIGRSGIPAASVIGELPRSLNANRVVVPNIIDFGLYRFLTDPVYPEDFNSQINAFNAAASRSFASGSLIGEVNATLFESVSGAQRVQSSVASYKSSVVYPEGNPLARGLRMVAQLMATIPEAQLMYARLGGFDTHAGQVDQTGGRAERTSGWHATLLRWFAEGVKAFYDDLNEQGLADETIIMQWSEFGRRPGENASFGTDHGTASTMFLIGNPVKGGIYGEQPSLAASALDEAGNPIHTVDFRAVYATILDHWLGADSREVLGASFEDVGFIGAA